MVLHGVLQLLQPQPQSLLMLGRRQGMLAQLSTASWVLQRQYSSEACLALQWQLTVVPPVPGPPPVPPPSRSPALGSFSSSSSPPASTSPSSNSTRRPRAPRFRTISATAPTTPPAARVWLRGKHVDLSAAGRRGELPVAQSQDAAVEVSDHFLKKGLIVYTNGRIANSELRFSATGNDLSENVPLAVLINSGSASASEIVGIDIALFLVRLVAACVKLGTGEGKDQIMHVMRRLGQLAACLALSTAAAAAAPASAQTLKMVAHSDLKVLDPIWTTAFITRNHGYMIYDTLFAQDADARIQPQMVDKYEASADKLTWTFTLRDGLEWHDGKPVTSRYIVFTHRMAQDKSIGFSNYNPWTRAKSVQVVDGRTVILHMDKLAPSFASWDQVLPSHLEEPVFNANPDANRYTKNTLYNTDPTNPGLWNGAYTLKSYQIGTRLGFA